MTPKNQEPSIDQENNDDNHILEDFRDISFNEIKTSVESNDRGYLFSLLYPVEDWDFIRLKNFLHLEYDS